MQLFKTRISWAIYIICAALFFFYYLFPSDAIKEYLADQIRQAQPYLTVKISRLKPAFPPGLKLYNVSVYHLDQTIAGLDNLKISPDILSLKGSSFVVLQATCLRPTSRCRAKPLRT